MSNDLHDIDDLFRSALEDNEETPSASVKESLLAGLDKKDAGSFKKRFIVWKRAAILLLLLLAGFVLYESAIWINGVGNSNKKITPLAIGAKKNDTAAPAKEAINEQSAGQSTFNIHVDDKNEKISKKENTTVQSRSDENNELTQPTEKENGELNNAPVEVKNYKQDNDLTKQNKKAPAKEQRRSLSVNKKTKQTIVSPIQDNTINKNEYAITSGENLIKEKMSFAPLAEKISLVKIDALSFTNLQHPVTIGLKMPAVIDLFLKNSVANNSNSKRIHHFKPYWTLTGLATYERVNYKLDSDLPDNITSIRHREIHEPSYSVGILATRQLKERWGLQTGLIYSNTSIGISPQKIFALQDPAGDIVYKYITSSGFAYIKPRFGAPPAFGDSLTTTEAKHNLQSVSIPVIIKHTIGKNKFLFIPGAGLEANFITRAKLETEIEDASNRETVFINKLNGAKSFYWSLAADAELRYIVNKNLAFSLRPVFRYAMSPITENNVVETFPYSFGAGLGLTYKF